ncbi:ABC transporter ATP-binding protein [Maridesulfovibrio ferrireducens]|uniref:ABC transporter ATP-binding protein/permease n=1 Tax=Maridesulfovibrio ferrireducens TaxID=246191 RepID=UPI001A2216F3|nr:ABC transporter ATP-binding protein [Maridesulfovibrio ferrireducens]MBI9112685.1 ABC transporter ATP-binding protein [Maridesulfovibrio ferrireducens]
MFKTIITILNESQRKKMITLVFISIIISCIETVGISAILPFITLANDFNLVHSNEYYRYVYNVLNFTEPKTFVLCFGIALIGFYFARGFMNLGYTYLIQKFSQGVFRSISTKLFSNYMHIKYQDMMKRNTSDLTKNLVSEAQYAGGYYYSLLLVISEVFVTTFLYATLLVVNYKITLAITVFLGIMVLFLIKTVSTLIKKEGLKRNDFQQVFYRVINESFGNLKFIKLLSCEDSTIKSLDKAGDGLTKATIMNATYNTIPRLSLECIGFSLLIAAIVCAIHYNMEVQQIIPILSLYALAMYRLLPSVNRILSGYNNMIYFNKTLELVLADYQIDTHKLGSAPLTYNKNITLNNLSFKYDENIILENINLTIKKGEKIAFIGESGAGKSTLADIVIGMYTSFSGKFAVDDIPLTEKNLLSWRVKIGYIPQSIYLFDSTVAQNVTFGRAYDEEKVKNALDKAELTTFLNKHNGINTQVGENGAQLSGGQKQRIAIARALYGEPDVLVLDEATSALDKETEGKIMQRIFKVSEDKTLIIIAHRLSTIKQCDKVYKIDNKGISLVTT